MATASPSPSPSSDTDHDKHSMPYPSFSPHLATPSSSDLSKSPVPLIPTLSRLSLSTTRPTLPLQRIEDVNSVGYTNKTIGLVSRGGKEVWRRSGLNHLWRADDTSSSPKLDESLRRPSFDSTPSSSSASLPNPELRTQALDTSSILYPTLSTHPRPLQHHILIMSLAQIAQSPSTISNDGLFDILLRRLEPWVGEEGDGGYVLIIFAAEGGEVYGVNKHKQVRKLPGVAWWVWKYKRIPKKYRKNLKRLYIVHPSLFTRTLLPLIIPFLSPKSYPKLHPLASLLSLHHTHGVPLKGIDITMPVLEAEAKLLADRPDLIPSSSTTSIHRPAPVRHSSDSSVTSWSYQTLSSAVGTAASYLSIPAFSAPTDSEDMSSSHLVASGYWHRDLAQLVEECHGKVPPLLVHLVKVILEECSGTKGIFRRGSNSTLFTPLEALLSISLDTQPNLPWTDIAKQDPLLPPKVLSRFLSELSSPVIDSNLYDTIRSIKTVAEIKTIFLPNLPPSYRLVLQHIIHMFHHLSSPTYGAQTKMSAFSYAVVIAPSLIAGPSRMEDAAMCLEPGKSLPEAMRKALGDGAADSDMEKGEGTVVGLLELWIKAWPMISGDFSTISTTSESLTEPSPDRASSLSDSVIVPGVCQCAWASSAPSVSSGSHPVVGTPATAPAPASMAAGNSHSQFVPMIQKTRSDSIRHSLLGQRSVSRSSHPTSPEVKSTPISEKL